MGPCPFGEKDPDAIHGLPLTLVHSPEHTLSESGTLATAKNLHGKARLQWKLYSLQAERQRSRFCSKNETWQVVNIAMALTTPNLYL